MFHPLLPHSFTILLATLINHVAAVTVYTTYTSAAPGSSPTSVCIGASACDPIVNTLVPNPAPGQGLSQSIPIQLYTGGMPGLGQPVKADFQGFSIELSIVNQISKSPMNVSSPPVVARSCFTHALYRSREPGKQHQPHLPQFDGYYRRSCWARSRPCRR